MTFLVGEEWVEAPHAESSWDIFPGVTHDFQNRSDAPATAFNIFLPGWLRGAVTGHGSMSSRRS